MFTMEEYGICRKIIGLFLNLFNCLFEINQCKNHI